MSPQEPLRASSHSGGGLWIRPGIGDGIGDGFGDSFGDSFGDDFG